MKSPDADTRESLEIEDIGAAEAQKAEARFRGSNLDLPSLNYGTAAKENRPKPHYYWWAIIIWWALRHQLQDL